MKALIIGSGPSALRFHPDMAQFVDVIIAINRGAEILEKHGIWGYYWVFRDVNTTAEWPWGYRAIVCPQSTRAKLGEHMQMCEHIDSERWRIDAGTWHNTSGPDAFCLAAHLGCSVARTIGVDMEGEESFDGVAEGIRTEGRWATEKAMVHKLLAHHALAWERA